MKNSNLNTASSQQKADTKAAAPLTEYRSGPNDEAYLNLLTERFTESADIVRLRIVEELQKQLKQLIMFQKDVVSLTDAEVSDAFKALGEHQFDNNELKSVSVYLVYGLYKIVKDHINAHQPPKRLNQPQPTGNDALIRNAVQKEEALIGMTFPDIATDAVSLELVKRDANGHYVGLLIKHLCRCSSRKQTLCSVALKPSATSLFLSWRGSKAPTNQVLGKRFLLLTYRTWSIATPFVAAQHSS